MQSVCMLLSRNEHDTMGRTWQYGSHADLFIGNHLLASCTQRWWPRSSPACCTSSSGKFRPTWTGVSLMDVVCAAIVLGCCVL